jgi:hypothetical protein
MRKLQLLLVAMLTDLMATPVIAGPAEEANAVVDRWATTFSTNDPDELTKIY